MKKQLVLLSGLLFGFLSLQSMDSPELSNQDNPVYRLNSLISEFMVPDQSIKEKLNIIATMRENFNREITAENLRIMVNLFLNPANDNKFIEQSEGARDLFAILYFIYRMNNAQVFINFLSEHPEKICSILSCCFNPEDYMEKPPYKNFIVGMLNGLSAYVDKKIQKIDQRTHLCHVIRMIQGYIGQFTLEMTSSFEQCKESLFHICQAVEQEELLSPREVAFHNFNVLARDYFIQVIKDSHKIIMLQLIKENLLKMISIEDIEYIKNEQTRIRINNFLKETIQTTPIDIKNATLLFGSIYFAYLSKHPNESCSALLTYLNEDCIKNICCRRLMVAIISILHSYVDQLRKEDSVGDKTVNIIQIIHGYINNFSEEKDMDNFAQCKEMMEKVCNFLNNIRENQSLVVSESSIQPEQEQNITEEKITPELSTALIRSALMQHQQKQNQEKANTATVAALANKAFEKPELRPQEAKQAPASNETNPQQTFWDWIMWIDKAIIDFGVSIRKAISGWWSKS